MDTQYIQDLMLQKQLIESRLSIIKDTNNIKCEKFDANSLRFNTTLTEEMTNLWNSLLRLLRSTERTIFQQQQLNNTETTNIGTRQSHDSYAVIKKTSPMGNKHLFGSCIDHMKYVQIAIARASITRKVDDDDIHSGQELIRINMSYEQWIQFVAGDGSNSHNGTPCTLNALDNRQISSIPFENKQSLFMRDLHNSCGKINEKLIELVNDAVKPLTNNGPLAKTDRALISNKITSLARDIQNDMPYMLTEYASAMEKMLIQQKIEIDSYKDKSE